MGYAVPIYQTLQLDAIECCDCSAVFAVTEAFKQNLLRTKQTFYCPNGHPQSYAESTAEKLRKELAEKEQALAWEKQRVESLGKQLKREQASTKRLKRRVSVGVCPCCQRTVSQLARHMQSKHPEFVQAAAT